MFVQSQSYKKKLIVDQDYLLEEIVTYGARIGVIWHACQFYSNSIYLRITPSDPIACAAFSDNFLNKL